MARSDGCPGYDKRRLRSLQWFAGINLLRASTDGIDYEIRDDEKDFLVAGFIGIFSDC